MQERNKKIAKKKRHRRLLSLFLTFAMALSMAGSMSAYAADGTQDGDARAPARPPTARALGASSCPQIAAQAPPPWRPPIPRQEMQAVITRNVALQKNKRLQLVPAPLKNLSMAVSYRLVGCRPYSTTYTNPGAFSVPPEMAPYIQRMEVILGQATKPRVHCASISYQNTMSIAFGGTLRETDTEREFFRFLVRDGIHVKVESNRNYGVKET